MRTLLEAEMSDAKDSKTGAVIDKPRNRTVPRDLPNRMVIGGKRVEALSGRRIETVDPATGRAFCDIPAGNSDDVDRAVTDSKRALKGQWRQITTAQRGRILAKAAALMRRDSEHLAQIETLDSGKPLRESRADVETSAYYFEYYAGIADKLQGDSIPLGPDYISFTLLEPVGVTAHIVPWNFPLVTTARGVAPALSAGNTAVVKPSSETSLTAIALADLLDEAGLPAGVYNVVTGQGREVGGPLTAHPDVAHVTFTGSVETGKGVMRSAADHVASVTLELGGKSPVVVFADADLESAVQGTIKAIYTNAGQVCSAGSRLIVERSVHAEMVERLVRQVKGLQIGHGLDDPQLGPLVSSQQLSNVGAYVDGARKRGIELATGGKRAEIDGLEGGFFFEPTIFDNVPPNEIIAQEEIFGPVLVVEVVESPEEAIAVANGTRFGLVAGIYTRDVTRALRFARDVDSGQVFINQFFAGGVATPFGGMKDSGFGREKGLAALTSYYRVKCVTARI
jgi:acyl-CoA reductase-like NAD-dependent aldehyde dehydrogenase